MVLPLLGLLLQRVGKARLLQNNLHGLCSIGRCMAGSLLLYQRVYFTQGEEVILSLFPSKLQKKETFPALLCYNLRQLL